MPKQHSDLRRKVALRRRVLSLAPPGAAYVPFCGDGDLADALYRDRPLYFVDRDPDRIATIRSRFPSATVHQADAAHWPLPGCREVFALADFDAYADPWPALMAFWSSAQVTDPCVLFITDGALTHVGRPSFRKQHGNESVNASRHRLAFSPSSWKKKLHSLVAPKTISTFFFYREKKLLYIAAAVGSGVLSPMSQTPPIQKETAHRAPYKFDPLRRATYLDKLREGGRRHLSAAAVGISARTIGRTMERDAAFAAAVMEAECHANEHIESALYESALNGNVVAQQVWLYNRAPDLWSDRRRHEHSGPDGGPLPSAIQIYQIFLPENARIPLTGPITPLLSLPPHDNGDDGLPA